MMNTGKKPISKKLEEARLKLFNNDSFSELLKPTFILKAYESTFICVLLSMILNYFVKSETCKESITNFIEVIISNTKEHLELEDLTEMNRLLLLSHPFTHRMVGGPHPDQEIHPVVRNRHQRVQSGARRHD